ncbi:MAG: DNA mismatch repair protein MutS [Firmicutes bacterium]|nr:DNA mismatch repair protein MutS [Bacillota bacterium]
MKRSEVNRDKLSPMMKQYMGIKDKYEDVVLLFRLGDFYELFFEDAINISRELELTLTGKNAGLEERIPMCGIPYHALNIYLEKLIEKGYKVGICEQTEDPKNVKGIVKREVVQIISKGTLINNELLNEKENNYIGNIYDFVHAYGISYTDISTGEFKTFLIDHDIPKLINEIINLNLNEIILTDKCDKNIINILKNQYHMSITVYDEVYEGDTYQYLYEDLNDVRYQTTIKHLLSYLLETQKRSLNHLQKVKIKDNNYLRMDVHTKRNLELTETLRLKQRTYSLIWLLDKTKTASGSRLLKQWIENPLVNRKEIEKRYNVIDTLLNQFIIKEELRNLLCEVYDIERLTGRIAYGNANGRDLIQLKNSLKVLPDIKKNLNDINFYHDIDTLEELYDLLESSIYETPPVSIKEGYLIKNGFNTELDELKEIRYSGKDFIAKLEYEERERTGIKTLKVGYNRVFGYYIEVSKGSISQVKEEFGYERKQTLSTGERYITPLLKEKEALVLNAEEKIVELEYNLFCEIRNQIQKYISKLQDTAKVLSEIDVLAAFTTVTEENKFVRPTLVNNREVYIKNNRHPVVEKVMKDEYVENDIIMGEGTNLLLITGPNMSGKSTYMRQFAITAIMAQIGCFVPATECRIPIFDKIFTRIGASDDLVSGESTFMVEMMEANNAIQNATSNSLILFDELGRGTATYDGMSLAQAILEYICNNIQAKTMFSTHYHELTSLDKKISGLKNIHVSAHEENGTVTFLHKIKNGPVDKSYGIHVARLAKLPDDLIKRANEILNVYEKKEKKEEVFTQISLDFDRCEPQTSKVEEIIRDINPLEITPLEALNILYELKKEIKEK